MATRKKSNGAADVDHRTLSPFDGREVASASIAITSAGDGLSQALGISPQEFHLGDKVIVLVECEVSKVGHSEIKDTALLNRVHTLKAGVGTIVSEEFAKDALAAQRKALEEAEGIVQLPGIDSDGAAVQED
jgi:hypothetical protein